MIGPRVRQRFESLPGVENVGALKGYDRAMQPNLLSRITIEEGKCGGRPCVRGLRIRVSDILDLLSHGATHDEILGDYPSLEREDILAALEYAARQADHAVLQSRLRS